MGRRILYISYDGLTDPLGQSQIIPYLVNLAKRQHQITVISLEKKERYSELSHYILEQLHKSNILWAPEFFRKHPKGIAAFINYIKLKNQAAKQMRAGNFEIVHCRSYIPAIIGAQLKRKFGCKLIFDMRGFWADERVEGGLWSLKNPFYRIAYTYFKMKEKKLLMVSNKIVTLTHRAKKMLNEHPAWRVAYEKIEVIPCCVDLDLFSYEQIDKAKQKFWKDRLKIKDGDLVITYAGSLGTWYLLEEMIRFYQLMHFAIPSARLLVITPDPSTQLYQLADKLGVDRSLISMVHASRNQMPEILSISHLALFLIRNTFSKSASSPTKMGELMAMGIPIICNSGVGDIDFIMNDTGAGFVLSTIHENDMQKMIGKMSQLFSISKEKIRAGAIKYYSLDVGVEAYHKIYCEL